MNDKLKTWRSPADRPARLAELKAGPRPDIRSWKVEGNKFVVQIGGLHLEGREGKPPVLSRYYFTLDRYDPFVGKPWLQKSLVRPFSDLDDMTKVAETSRAIWEDGLRQSRLLIALRVNRLLTNEDRVQVEVHLTFLGAFTHATQRAYDLAYGRGWPSRLGQSDHYSHELVALYVVAIACTELMTLRRALRRRPSVDLDNWTDTATRIESAQVLAGYFWFLSGAPTEYDRIAEVHTRLSRGVRKRQGSVATIRYYRNPMARLIGMHSSFQELTTGVVFESPFERADARMR